MPFFRDLPIRRKLTVAILGPTAASVLIFAIVIITYEFRTYRDDRARTLTVLADVLADNSAVSLASGDRSAAEEMLSALRAEPDIVVAALYRADGHVFASYARSGAETRIPSAAEAEGVRFEGDRVPVFRPVTRRDERVGTIYLQGDLASVRAQLTRYVQISAAALLGTIALVAALSSMLQRLISEPLVRLAETARQVSEKKDYSVRAQRFSSDELGLLTDAFNQMLTDIGERSAALQKAQTSLEAQTRQIIETVEVLGSSAKEIVEFTTQVAANASETATAVTQTTATVEEVRQSAHVTSEKARSVSDSAQRVAQRSQAGKRSTEDTIEGMNRIREQMGSIGQSMVRLSQQGKAIAQIVASVDDLAAQSSLLAVNAGIEAAKAGEQGKGFAVVAQEVKSLAAQSREATNQVRAILRDIQKATGDAVQAGEHGSKAVDAGVKQSTEAGSSIVALAESVGIAAQAASQIAASSQQQLIGMDQVAIAMESVKQSSLHNVDSARDLEKAARKLSDLGERLRHLVAQYQAPAGLK